MKLAVVELGRCFLRRPSKTGHYGCAAEGRACPGCIGGGKRVVNLPREVVDTGDSIDGRPVYVERFTKR